MVAARATPRCHEPFGGTMWIGWPRLSMDHLRLSLENSAGIFSPYMSEFWPDQVGCRWPYSQKQLRHSNIRSMNVYGGVVDEKIGEALQNVPDSPLAPTARENA